MPPGRLKRRKIDVGDSDHDSDGHTGGKSPLTTKKVKPSSDGLRRRKSDESQQISTKKFSSDLEISALASEVLQCTDPSLKNSQRIAEHLREGRLARHVKVFRADRSEVPLTNLLARQPVSGRDIRPKGFRKDIANKVWLLTFKNGTATKEVTALGHRIAFSLMDENTPEARLTALHAELARQYNSWPFELTGMGFPAKQMLVTLAQQALSASPMQIDQVYHSNTLTFQTRVHHIDANTGKHERFTVSATASDTAMELVNVPSPLPPLQIYNTAAQTSTFRSPVNPTYVTAPKLKKNERALSSQQAQQTAENAVYWIASQLQGLVATKTRMKELLVMYRTQIGLQKGRSDKEGLYGGESDLYFVTLDKRTLATHMRTSGVIARDLGVERRDTELVVYSLNASRATPVMETVLQLFCAGFDIRYVWLQAAKTADLVNMDIADGIAPSSRCDCDESRVGVEIHPCEGCSKDTLCKTRSYDSMSRLVCVRCLNRDRVRQSRGKRAGESLAAYLAYRSLQRSLTRECHTRGLDPESDKMKDIFNAAFKILKKRLPGEGVSENTSGDMRTKYVDEWTKMSFDVAEERALVGNNPSRRRYHPAGITVDAIFRQGHPDNYNLKHSGKNLVVTSNACQMAHGSFNPGVMHEIASFKKKSIAEQGSAQAQKDLVNAMTAMAMVNCKRAYINAGKGDEISKHQKIYAEAIAGRPTPDENGPWENQAQQYISSTKIPVYQPGGENLCSEEEWSRIQQCAISMEKYFGVKLYKLSDGTRWIGSKHTNPKDLDRNGVIALTRERLKRMRIVCNKKWQTHDTHESLYQEIIFQYCCSITQKAELAWLSEKYGDRLRLPLVLVKHSPLRFSIAHREHGFGMHTGWPIDSPLTDVKQRIENDKENNMLVESWYVNSSKFDMAEEYYDILDTILSNVEIVDKSIYNPASKLIKGGDVEIAETGRIEDEFIAATFDSSAIKEQRDEVAAELPADDGGELPADHGGDQEMAEVGTMASPIDFTPAVEAGYRAVLQYQSLREMLPQDAELQRILAKLREIADNSTDPDAVEQFQNWQNRLYVEFVDPAAAKEA